MKTMPLPFVGEVLEVEEGFMDEDRPPDFFLRAKDGRVWHVSGTDLSYMESRTKINKAYLGIENRIRSIFKDEGPNGAN
jgi:hypothetical protein